MTLSNKLNGKLTLSTDNIQRMVIENDGDVGIGTIAPNTAARLHVKGGDIHVEHATSPALRWYVSAIQKGNISIQNGDRILAIASDVRDLASEQQAIKTVNEKWGQLDVLIAIAVIGKFAPIQD